MATCLLPCAVRSTRCVRPQAAWCRPRRPPPRLNRNRSCRPRPTQERRPCSAPPREHPRRAPMSRPDLGRPETVPFALSAALEASSPLPPPTQPVRRTSPGDDYDGSETRSSMPSSLDEPYSMRRGRRVGGWIVALVLLLAVGVLGWAVARHTSPTATRVLRPARSARRVVLGDRRARAGRGELGGLTGGSRQGKRSGRKRSARPPRRGAGRQRPGGRALAQVEDPRRGRRHGAPARRTK